MADDRLPFLVGRMADPEPFRNPQGGGGTPPVPPARDPRAHAAALRADLVALAAKVAARPAGLRVEGATRELVAIEPEQGHGLAAESLGSQPRDVRVVFEDPASGLVLLDAPDAALPHLQQKIEQYAGDGRTPKGKPKNEPALAPIHAIRPATVPDRAGPKFTAEAPLAPDVPRWYELTCRGGVHDPVGTQGSRAQIHEALARMAIAPPPDFEATENVVFYVRLTVAQLELVVAATDAVMAFDLVEPAVLDWLVLQGDHLQAVDRLQVQAPAPDAPSVVLLDTGLAAQHPVLAPIVLSTGHAVGAGPQDVHGHGTQMAGIAAFDELGLALLLGQTTATHWLQGVKIVSEPFQGGAGAENRQYWPMVTADAVALAEGGAARPRAFVMALSAAMEDPPGPTTWSHALDQLAFNAGEGRLFAVAVGNAPVQDLAHLHGYPDTCLVAKAQDPTQAANALTIGAYTRKTHLPPALQGGAWRALAPMGGISPHSSSGQLDVAIKPDVVFEGGNVAFDGHVGNPAVDSLVALTTHRLFGFGRPLHTICATSEAAAHAGYLAARIWRDHPGLWAQTVRGLVVHAADWTPAMLEQFPGLADRLAACGYGIPDPVVARTCVVDRATVVVESSLANRILVEPGPGDEGKPKEVRMARFFRLPVPEALLLEQPDAMVGLRVTLSYFSEPNTFRRVQQRGMDLRWDMQGPAEDESAFRARVNKLARDGSSGPGTRSFQWAIGPQRRGRGTVQSDRWRGAAAELAGAKLLAVYPVGGWWDARPAMRLAEMRFSLLVTVEAPGLPIYAPMAAALAVQAPAVVIDA